MVFCTEQSNVQTYLGNSLEKCDSLLQALDSEQAYECQSKVFAKRVGGQQAIFSFKLNSSQPEIKDVIIIITGSDLVHSDDMLSLITCSRSFI